MTTIYDDATLMAFADGALEEPLFSQIADAVEADPALAEQLEMLVLGKDLTKAVYAPLADVPMPQNLLRSVTSAIGGRERASRRAFPARAWSGVSSLAIAACIGVVVAGPLGYLLGNAGQTTTGHGLRIGGPLSQEIASYVQTLPSGAEQSLADGSRLRPVATFADASGSLCREFELDGATATVAVACRQSAQWQVSFALDAPLAQDGYAPAGALEALDTYLASIGATAPFPLAREAEMLGRP